MMLPTFRGVLLYFFSKCTTYFPNESFCMHSRQLNCRLPTHTLLFCRVTHLPAKSPRSGHKRDKNLACGCVICRCRGLSSIPTVYGVVLKLLFFPSVVAPCIDSIAVRFLRNPPLRPQDFSQMSPSFGEASMSSSS